VQPALQVLGGVRVFLTRSVAVFAEYRFLQSQTFTFDFKQPAPSAAVPLVETARDRADLTRITLSAGISFHWR